MTVDRHIDEETPLLPSPPENPIPWFQFTIVMLLQLAEPLSSHVIYPFAPELIRDIGITHGNESRVGYYVGLMQSLFYLAEAIGVLYWSRMSDHFGRKPVILIGLFGVAISSLCFGLSKTFWTLVVSRCVSGALNGNVGVIKTTMTELTDPTNLPRLWPFLPLSWFAGVTIGPLIGGYLSRPADRFPSLFGQSAFMKQYPYFLPCAVPAAFSAFFSIVAIYFLKETLRSPAPISQILKVLRNDRVIRIEAQDKPTPLRAVLTSRVIVAVGNYAFVALIEIAFRAIQPLFLATPVTLGGLGLSPPEIGVVLSLSGIVCGIFQVAFFARIHTFLGSKRTFVVGMMAPAPFFLMFPIANMLARIQAHNGLLWLVVGTQAMLPIAFGLSYGSIFMYITAASPNRASLGATHGISQMAISLTRAFGPAAANGLFSLSIERNYLGGNLVYYILFAASCLGMVLPSLLPRKVWN